MPGIPGIDGAVAVAVAAPQGQPQLQWPQSQASQTEQTKPQQDKTVVATNFNMEKLLTSGTSARSSQRESQHSPCRAFGTTKN
jgi:hypothetical protein